MNRSSLKKHFAAFFLLCLIFLPFHVLAAGSLDDALGNVRDAGARAGTEGTSVDSFVGTVINVALSMVGIIFLGLMVYAGYLWMTARGEESQVERAQDIIKRSVIGLVIVMSAYAVTALVVRRLEDAG